ncbi:hypothetical protein [Enterococcus sp. CSURQ0835]|uniref:hypothetical protein n=1 Tax=Enterococcus sp. CSURQ0835 TaxID=2681394 RepID=UPI001359A9D1|nr:hypothetical protein [Enterococcus sp. CSURQ0835]
MVNNKPGMSAITVGKVLYGYCFGIGTKRHEEFHQFEIAKVGRDYVYDKSGRKVRLMLDKRYYPQFDTLVAQDNDPNHRYKYYMTQKGAEKGLKVRKLRIQLSINDFRQPSDDVILKIAKLMELD